MSDVKCFWLEPTDVAEAALRRYVSSDRAKCQLPPGYHDAMTPIEDLPWEQATSSAERPKPPRDDPRWPTKCACGYVFGDDDTWQVFVERKYRRADTGATVTLRNAPIGSMWNAEWMGPHVRGPDGRCLVVKLPDGREWMIDGPASNSKQPWQRSGTVPKITARPSILTDGYHGFLTDGVLRSC